MDDREQSVQHFLDLIKRSHRGKFKIYIGMIAGVGKSYRMLQEAHELLENGVDVQIGYVETHGRVGTEAMLQGLPVISRRKIFYKGKELEEMDLDTIIRIHPEIVIVDELAHTNVEGSLNEKRWQDVMALLDEGINVISAINIQHIESVNEEVQEITGIEVKERVPDSVLQEADEVVNIDLTAEELIARLKAGKIYRPEKIQTALDNFFRTENILQLRELALKEVALRVEKKVENEVVMGVAVGLMKLGANHPMGPLALGDLIGLDIVLDVMEVLYTETGDPKYRPCTLLKKMVRAGKLGQKTKQGFYILLYKILLMLLVHS